MAASCVDIGEKMKAVRVCISLFIAKNQSIYVKKELDSGAHKKLNYLKNNTLGWEPGSVIYGTRMIKSIIKQPKKN